MIVELEAGVELEPCPFCGVEAVLKSDSTLGQGQYFWVKCTNPKCGASPAAGSDKLAVIEAWNRRA